MRRRIGDGMQVLTEESCQVTLKRLRAGQQFIEQNAKGVEIALRAGGMALQQFGRQVGHGAHNNSLLSLR